jgi:schlafen family protein
VIPEPIDQINWTDIEALISNKVRERQTLDYKAVLPGKSDEEKKDFLKDITALANSSGGHLVYGVSDEDGVPHGALGLADFKFDETEQRLRQLIRDCVDPPLHGVEMAPIACVSHGKGVLVVRVRRSWSRPHVVRFGKHFRFYDRRGTVIHQMDVFDLRSAFVATEALPEKVRAFRDERLDLLASLSQPVPLNDGPKLVVHVVPASAFDLSARVDVRVAKAHDGFVCPVRDGRSRFNADGFVRTPQVLGSAAYVQAFHNGIIEGVLARFFVERDGVPVEGTNPQQLKIESNEVEKKLLEMVPGYVRVVEALGCQPPIFILVSLVGVKGLGISANYSFTSLNGPHAIDRDIVKLPDFMIQEFSEPTGPIVDEIMNAIWQASGYDGRPPLPTTGI